MSLDIYLNVEKPIPKLESSGIWVRENGATKEISVEEWNARHPDREPVVLKESSEPTTTVFSGNITHNLNTMAERAGIYKLLWRPEELEIHKAKQLIKPLSEGLAILVANPTYFKQFNPENGWGDYEGLVELVEDYLAACRIWPEATITVSR